MALKFNNNLDLLLNQLLNVVLQNLPAHPSSGVKGQMYFNTTENKPYYHNGAGFVSIGAGESGVADVVSDGSLEGNGTSSSPLAIAASVLAEIAGKQAQLTEAQLDATNSGVTAAWLTEAQTALSNLDDGSNPVLRVLSVLDTLDSTAKDAPLSADAGRRLYNMISGTAENGRNMGAFDTYAALLAAHPTPEPGSYAYVRADENHGGETWRYDQGQGLDTDGATKVWSATIKVNEVPRDFEQEPVTAAELADGAVTLAKIASSVFDSAPTASSDNLVRSGAIVAYLVAGFMALTGNQTIAGQKTFSDTTVLAGHLSVSWDGTDIVLSQI